jgi:hypothetical protein
VSKSAVLRTLHLNRQPALGLLTHMYRLAKQLHTRMCPPLVDLMKALATSSLQTLELRDCGLNPQDWGYLNPIAKSATLKRLDLRGNDAMSNAHRADECRCMLFFIATLDLNTSLKEVRLPSPAADWFRAGIRSLADLQADRSKLELPNNHTLRVLSPLTDTDKPVLESLAARVSERQRQALTLLMCVRDRHFNLPQELEEKIASLLLKMPSAAQPH